MMMMTTMIRLRAQNTVIIIIIIIIMFMNDQVCFLFLDPQNEVGPSISFLVVLYSFVFWVIL